MPVDTERGYVTWWSDHSLPLLEEGRLEAVPGAEAVRLVTRHQLLHGLQDDAQLKQVTHN